VISLRNRKLKRSLEGTISKLHGGRDFSGEIKVSVYDIESGVNASVGGNDSGWAASIIKVPIMISTLQEIEKGSLTSRTKLEVNHEFMLEPWNYVSRLPDKSKIGVKELIYRMIVASDNEATNILANHIGIERINRDMWELGMENSMLGHLLCPGAQRYTSPMNPDGSNITCPNDMVKIMRHIYDDSFSKLNSRVRANADKFLDISPPHLLDTGEFRNSYIKAKAGYISDPKDGEDIHEVGIIDDHLVVCVMLNKVKDAWFFDRGLSDREGESPWAFPVSKDGYFQHDGDYLMDPSCVQGTLSGMKHLPGGVIHRKIMNTIANNI
jgi:hypothetical protein